MREDVTKVGERVQPVTVESARFAEGEPVALACGDGAEVNGSTVAYRIFVHRQQQRIVARVEVVSSGSELAGVDADLGADPGTGQPGLYADVADALFDNFKAYDATVRDPQVAGFSGSAKTSISSGTLLVESGSEYGGAAIVDGFAADDFIVEADVDVNGGDNAYIYVRYVDPNNTYQVRVTSSYVYFEELENGVPTGIGAGASYSSGGVPVIRVVADGNDFDVYVDGTLKLSRTDSTHAAGRVALGGDKPLFDDLRIGFDLNSDGDIDDVGTDKVVVDRDFGSTSTTFTYDDAGNLVDDGKLVYAYDAWNRLVRAVNAEDTSVTIHEAEFDGRGRRIKKVVTNAGPDNGTVVFYYNGWKMIETRDGSGNLYQQFIHGTQYIDEIVMTRIADQGEYYVHQDANWNVIALTDMGGNVLERYEYTPYGQFTAHQVTGFGDRDGDGDVDATDKGTPGTTCSGTVTGACRILDLDFDGDYDSADATLFDALPQGLARHPGLLTTALDFPFAHQGLYYDPELGSYQNRHRQYDPKLRRFMQRDPLGLQPRGGGGYQDGQQLYAYVQQNPIARVDAEGLGTPPVGCPPRDPGQANPPSGLSFLAYGKYCGPGHGGEGAEQGCANDCVDWACCRHDTCYYNQHRPEWWQYVHLASQALGIILDPGWRRVIGRSAGA